MACSGREGRPMSLSYYDVREKPQTKIATGLIILNAAMSFAMVFYWSGLAGFVGEPYKWAMRGNISPTPALFEYPYLGLWMTPLLCMCGGWLALKGDRAFAARMIGFYPTVMLILMLGWYYLTPMEWH